MRLDVKVAEMGLAPSREKARAFIMAGEVLVDGFPVTKPAAEVKDESKVELKANPIPFVSRGGLKLKKAIDEFELKLEGCVGADVGSSTGGFTDCMLQNGATKVYAIDVGYGQLDWKLRNDPRVVVMERTNARNMEPSWFETELDFASVDVSFISLKIILPPIHACLKDDGIVLALIKPQFEAGRGQVGKNGVVRDVKIHQEVIKNTLGFARSIGFSIEELTFSPIKGPKGNIEFLVMLKKTADAPEQCPEDEQWAQRIAGEASDALRTITEDS